MIIKDNANRSVILPNGWTLRACDVDENGNIENIDLINPEGRLVYCANSRTSNLGAVLSIFLDALTNA